MSVYQLKSQFQNQLRLISNELVRLGFTANQVTVSAIFLSAGSAYFIATSEHSQRKYKLWWILPISLFIRMVINAIDGMMAREHAQSLRIGAVLNEAGDIISDSLFIASCGGSLAALLVDVVPEPKQLQALSISPELFHMVRASQPRVPNQENSQSQLLKMGCFPQAIKRWLLAKQKQKLNHFQRTDSHDNLLSELYNFAIFEIADETNWLKLNHGQNIQ